MKTQYNKHEFYRAHLARDPRFDGKFFVAVKTTMIYCRPVCPARKAKLENLEFYIHAAEAEEAGFRPCLRCRPETAPGSAAWIGTSDTVQRAIRLMDSFEFDEISIKGIAEKLGIGERWLRELFQQEVGASPRSILMAKKLDVARNLLDHSSLSITDIAFSSGFQSIRRFNDAFKERFKQSPSSFRKGSTKKNQLQLQLSYRPPYAWDQMLQFFKMRSIPGVELVDDESYQRLFTQGDVRGWFRVTHRQHNNITIDFKVNKSTNIIDLVARIKNLFDLDADPMVIHQALEEDEKLQPYINQFKGIRIPGTWDGFELAVRAIVGQRISVKAARTILGRIVEKCGEQQTLDSSLPLSHYFPTPQDILAANLADIGLPKSRLNSLLSLAQEMSSGNIVLDGTANYEETCQKLHAIKGIGKWTVEYIAMRALKNPDAFPETDLEIQKKITRLKLDPKKWVPWRAYAAVLLWNIKLEKYQ